MTRQSHCGVFADRQLRLWIKIIIVLSFGCHVFYCWLPTVPRDSAHPHPQLPCVGISSILIWSPFSTGTHHPTHNTLSCWRPFSTVSQIKSGIRTSVMTYRLNFVPDLLQSQVTQNFFLQKPIAYNQFSGFSFIGCSFAGRIIRFAAFAVWVCVCMCVWERVCACVYKSALPDCVQV